MNREPRQQELRKPVLQELAGVSSDQVSLGSANPPTALSTGCRHESARILFESCWLPNVVAMKTPTSDLCAPGKGLVESMGQPFAHVPDCGVEQSRAVRMDLSASTHSLSIFRCSALLCPLAPACHLRVTSSFGMLTMSNARP